MQMNSRQIIVIAGLAMALLSMPIAARNGVMILLPDKRVAVLSEGDLEPGSIGSYSVAVFKDDSLTQLDTGAVFARDGSFIQDDGKPRVQFADIAGDGSQALIVSNLSAGSGNYLEVDALSLGSDSIRLLARVQTDTRHDPLVALRAAYRRKR
ncbi:hypothetical protein WJ07_17360 [Burkholderia vietnamiensis]|uniref:PliI family lysozyme inhibitor of I-type lysozyme n=1 Tax=Burkholderia vietnamiensis TaxID=60552 RepID=UPI00075340F0|nr:PliI family lysozyme inhibitor of I-type lysozyme [Burkholderia vietnamiensis]KVF22493.1 hypothetical protein WJ07_17360 [Burkholderia vietnamiensis]